MNLTQHNLTNEQIVAGGVETTRKGMVKTKLTFEEMPSKEEIEHTARVIARIAGHERENFKRDKGVEITHALIGGAPYLMSSLEKELRVIGIKPVYAFTKRVSVEEQKEDGTVEKKSVFKFEGWIEV